MSGLLSILLAYPTVVFTGLLGLMMLYWLFVILGALDIDLFHADADGALEGIDGAAKGAFEGAAKGALEVAGSAKGAFEAAGKGGADAVVDVLGGADGADGALDAVDGKAEAASGLLHALNLRRAPVTVTFSFIVLFGWILSYIGVHYLGSSIGAILPTWLFSTLVLVASIVGSLPLASLATKPMQGVFDTKAGPQRIDFIGSEVRIRTGSVDTEFGQAELDDGQAGMIIQVRNEGGKLKRGDRALIIDFDRETEAYVVEAYDAMLEDEAAAKARRKLS